MLRDLFVLVLQTSGLQQITSRAGFDVDFGTLLVADPSSAFLRVTLWRSAARVGARLIRAGDLVRLNRSGPAKVKASRADCSRFQAPDSRLESQSFKSPQVLRMILYENAVIGYPVLNDYYSRSLYAYAQQCIKAAL